LIRIFYDNTLFRLRGSRKALQLIDKVIRKENKISGDLNFIFTNKYKLREINKEFLNHDYFTDVIAFGYPAGNKIEGEVYMDIDTIQKNAVNYKVSLKDEVIRVMIHGTLHLCGYEDRTEGEKLIMREEENYWIGILEKEA
jgi:probable rRNA maturation factor